MPDPKIKKVEQKVLEVYQKENPSTYNIDKDKHAFDRLKKYSNLLYTHSLKLLPSVFNEAKLIEIGTGTGEKSLSFLRWKANCTFVEMNDKAIERADFLFKKYFPNSNYKIINSSLFEFKTDQLFDIAVSIGVIHHTQDKEKAFAKQISYLKPGGINVLGIGTTTGGFQRNLQRYIIYTFAGRDEKKIERIANDLFKEHLDRAIKFGGRSRKAIIYDSYVNPKIDLISIYELIEWYKKYNLTLYSNWPPIKPSILSNSLASYTDWTNFPELLSFPEWIWSNQRDNDKELAKILEKELASRTSSFRKMAESVNDVQAEDLKPSLILDEIENVFHSFSHNRIRSLQEIRQFKTWLTEVRQVVKALIKEDYEEVSSSIKRSKRLFRGTSGVGLNYFVAIKE